MNSNYPRSLIDRRPMNAPNCMQIGMPLPSDPSTHQHLPHGDSVTHVPFLVYPTSLESTYYDSYGSMFPYMPFHGHFGVYDCPFEPAFIQKRNERERQRVKCVNEGYARLRDHLPEAMSEKRLSKVETLRAAIRYIKYLQDLLSHSPDSSPQLREEPQKDNKAHDSPVSKQDCNSDGESKSSSPYCESEVSTSERS
ncbi:achaete-scute homolog 5-like [Carcharodon carcharias]|uniref:achaete-scute homolog 5-like n=1 Tax=Carcharodon carcharias TaxID=13397 RepID=UPI001B7F35F6|nr:achaete-scute homolog 5-like [Carcharodon carcharias]